ncbi:MAG: hypothetical protein GY913_35985 [Proteobacteria bacterium]|nr:hypothetical protein [Pseudomonadota bacterium]MCP4922332.1 hypothetical protein [Pseudomonadota bacterium]
MHVTTLFDRPDAPMEAVVRRSWPDWMFGAEGADLLGIVRRFPRHQVILFEGSELVAVGNSVPLAQVPDALPDDGWDWALRSAAPGPHRCALAVSVLPTHRGRGLSSQVLRAFGPTLVPVRPNGFTGGDFAEHVAATRGDGLPVDPWLRTHVRLGGRVEGVCSRSMTLRASPDAWEGWDRSGLLAELTPDGVYVEPNVWVRHG